jgi:tetratricopeptide (TPR) repeat protein
VASNEVTMRGVFCWLLIFVPAFAQDEDDTIDAVGAAVAELKKADDPTFAKLAARDEPDPWLVADRLARAGETELALRFATADKRPAVEGLPAYLRSLAKSPPSAAVAQAIDAAQTHLEDAEATKDQLAGVRRSLTAALAGANPLERARLLSLRGFASAYMGDVAESRRDLEDAAAAARKIGWLREQADALGTASENARVLFLYDDALALARRELGPRHRLGDSGRVVAHLRRVSTMLEETGDSEGAIKELEGWKGRLDAGAATEIALERAHLHLLRASLDEALAILRSEVDPQTDEQRGRIRMLAGDILRQAGDEQRAVENYRQAASLFEKAEAGIPFGRALGNAGVGLIRLGRADEARVLLERAQAQFDAAKDRELVALAVLFRGDARLAAGEPAKALRLHNAARTFAARSGDGWLEASALLRRARALLASGETEQARRAYAACHEVARQLSLHDLAADGAAGEAHCLLRQGHAARAAEAAERGIRAFSPLVEGRAVPPGDEAHRIFQNLSAAEVAAAFLLDSVDATWRALERRRTGLLVTSANQASRLRISAMTDAARAEEAGLRRAIRRGALFEERARQEDDRATAVAWKAKREEAERKLDRLVRNVQLLGKRGSVALFPRTSTLLTVRERLRHDEVLVSYALAGTHAAALVATRAEVRRMKLDESASVKREIASIDFSKKTGSWDPAALRRLLLDPLGLRKSQTTVILVLPPALAAVPFAALDSGRAFLRTPSGTEFDLARGRRFAPREGTIREWGSDGTAHVYVGPAPDVDWIEKSRAAADLALLTDAQGSTRLARAFLFRGTPNVVACLWKPDANAAKAFETELLRIWSDDRPPSAADAVRLAQEHVRKQKAWSDPVHWAGWTVWGR